MENVEIVRCLLCRGVVTLTSQADIVTRYKKHLKIEHRVFFGIDWILQKTVDEKLYTTGDGDDDEADDTTLGLGLLSPKVEMQQSELKKVEKNEPSKEHQDSTQGTKCDLCGKRFKTEKI